MGTLTIRNLDDKVIERLEMRAKNHRRSLEAELRDLLSHAAQQPLAIDALVEADRIAALTPKGVKQTDSVILLREDRSR
jgi:plasmid stability protein